MFVCNIFISYHQMRRLLVSSEGYSLMEWWGRGLRATKKKYISYDSKKHINRKPHLQNLFRSFFLFNCSYNVCAYF